jgi:hypothetical protein
LISALRTLAIAVVTAVAVRQHLHHRMAVADRVEVARAAAVGIQHHRRHLRNHRTVAAIMAAERAAAVGIQRHHLHLRTVADRTVMGTADSLATRADTPAAGTLITHRSLLRTSAQLASVDNVKVATQLAAK